MSPPAATDVGMPEMKKNGTTQKPAADTDSVNGFKHAPQKPLPDFKDLPRVAGMPRTCAWGLFDTLSSSQPDEIGTLNLLTPERKVRARQEIQHGISVAITWSLDNCETPHSGRMRPEHRIKRLPDWVGHDDEIRMNTQSGSQWDGLRHWAHQLTGLFYNGVQLKDIMGPESSLRNGIDQWSKHGGIVGRGILLDYLSWAESQGIDYSSIERHTISEKDLEAVAAWQGTNFEVGDILLVRSGFVKWHNNASDAERKAGIADGEAWAGVEGTEASVEWFWNHHFAAVGGDANVFEAWPAKDERYRLHDVFLAMWGMPIGEMFDLDELAEVCKRHQRWSFFFTSAPLNFPGGVASPPNAICVL